MKDTLPTELPAALPVEVVDSHTHLDTVEAYTGCTPDEAISAAAAVGVTRLAQIGCDVDGSRWAVELAHRHPGVIATVALHPNEAARTAARSAEALRDGLAAIEALLADPNNDEVLRGVGETGLDYYRTTDPTLQAAQQESFAAHIELAHRFGRTLVIHNRDSHDDLLAVLDEATVPDRVIMHCFSGDAAFAEQCLDRGAWLSFPGTVTYKANHELREALKIVPLDRLLVETDAPFLTPVPHRGWPNAPVLIPHTVEYLAEQRGEPLEQVAAALTENAFAAYGGQWSANPD
ncbi:TatD family hydrolase [Enemella sp. A6]|uniref:TatD family hydrolase n=1 Tax=Enemella sp. A6 TaxID=3440152 RepID=UPI003EBBE383